MPTPDTRTEAEKLVVDLLRALVEGRVTWKHEGAIRETARYAHTISGVSPTLTLDAADFLATLLTAAEVPND